MKELKPLRIVPFLLRVSAVILVFVLSACARKNDKWLNRHYHAMTTYYNIVYHGNMSLENGVTHIKNDYIDDFWEVLPIEPLFNDKEEIVYGKMINPETRKIEGGDSLQDLEDSSIEEVVEPDFRNRLQRIREERKRRSETGNTSRDNVLEERSGLNRTTQGRETRERNIANQTSNRTRQTGNSQDPNQNRNQNAPQGYAGQNQRGVGANGLNRNGAPNGRIGQNQDTDPMANFGYGNQNGRYDGDFGQNTNRIGTRGGQMAIPQQTFVEPNPSRTFEEEALAFDKNESFEVAEGKAVDAVQKHSMIYKGVEQNSQIKDAFLLLGKSRYYQQHFFPALEAFNYILNRYEDEAYLTAADIWIEKTYLRLGDNEERVIKRLTYLLDNSTFVEDETVKDTITQFELSREDLVETTSTLAQAYLNAGQDDRAIKMLDIAISKTKDKDLRGRYLYIKGQILEKTDSEEALAVYEEMVELNRKIPRLYWIRANMKKLELSANDENTEEQLDALEKMLKDWELRPYQDIINYQIAETHKDADSMELAIHYYDKTLQTHPQDHKLRYHIYRTLADYYYDRQNYGKAGSYYDSTMVNLPAISRTYRDLKKIRLNLFDVVDLEEIAQTNDSIIHLAKMTPKERETYLSSYMDSLKNIEITKIEKLSKSDLRKQSEIGHIEVPSASYFSSPNSSFYFYNPSQVERGRQSFKRIWGDRALTDNWRTEANMKKKKRETSDKASHKMTKEDLIAQVEQNPKYDISRLLKSVPEDDEVIAALVEERNKAYYQLGLIYDENLKEYALAADRLERLLEEEQDEELIKPAKYRLYKLYKQLGRPNKAEAYKNDIITQYPESRFAKIIRDPDAYKRDETNPQTAYNKIYKSYEAGNYTGVLTALDDRIVYFGDDEIVPKMELLRAIVKGRLEGIQAYKEGLQHVAKTYPNRVEGQKAQAILDRSINAIKDAEFVENIWVRHKLIYPFEAGSRSSATALKEKLDTYLENENFDWLHTSIDSYSSDKIFVVIHGLRSLQGLEEFKDLMDKKTNYEIKRSSFGISSDNYEKMLIYKSLKVYLEWSKKQKTIE